jgi:predicted nuclease with RNAse H fold
MQTLGIDLAAQPEKTGVAWLEWAAGKARVTELHVGASDETLLEAMAKASKTGIDCPLGWPREFVAFVSKHQDDHIVVEPGLAADWRRRLSYRVTDLHVKSTVPGIQGLSVSSDRIGVTTMRCAALLSQLAALGAPVVRTGIGPVAEVYPAASLVRWGFSHKGYKGSKAKIRRSQLVDELLLAAPWLDLGAHEGHCRASDDALDAVLASLTARAAALGLTEPIPAGDQRAAEIEGWIALPAEGSRLAELAEPR